MKPQSISPSQPGGRSQALDALRGIAMLWMTGFHFCFDLSHLGFWRQDFYRDPFWLWQRTAILSLFLLCAGIAAAGDKPRFWPRWRQIAAAALLVSAGSWWMFPGSFIYFGVLHGIAVMLLLLRYNRRLGSTSLLLLGLGFVVLAQAAPQMHQSWPALQVLNQREWSWLGLVSRKPITEDFVPLLPWLGVMCWGVVLGRLLGSQPWWGWPLPLACRPLVLLGRWGLSYYLLHQPVLIGLLMLWAWCWP